MTYLCLLSYSPCTEVAVESSSVPLLKPVGLVVHLEMVKTGIVLTVFLSHGDGISHFSEGFPLLQCHRFCCLTSVSQQNQLFFCSWPDFLVDLRGLILANFYLMELLLALM